MTFQNLKPDARNVIFPEDKDNIWIPWLPTKNMENKFKSIQTEDVDYIMVLPNKKYEFSYNSKEHHQNAFLFKDNMMILKKVNLNKMEIKLG